MSKLETAFSKALKERSKLQGQTGEKLGAQGGNSRVDVNADIPQVQSVVIDDQKKEIQLSPNSLATVRTQIRGMSHGNLLSDEELAKRRIVYPRMKDANLLNIYRNLRTKLLARSKAGNFVTLVTSVVPGGGSSLISANLAATFAFDEGKTALLVEGNIHQPSLAKLFSVEKDRPGLMDFLKEDSIGVPGILQDTGISRLRFIPAGKYTESSAEFFTSLRMRKLMEEVAKRYPERYPIIDAPSIADSADTQILIDLCDQVVLVIPYGECNEDDIKHAVETIGKSKLAGVVLNQF